MYRPPNKSNFFELITEHLNKIDSIIKEIYILGDFNVNLFLNYSYIFPQIYTFSSLHQFIKVPTRITCDGTTVIDHILASYPERLTQQDIIVVGLSDHQFIFSTKKISRIKRGMHKHIKFHLFKHYSTNLFQKTLSSINFTNYQRLLKHQSST